MIKNRKYSVVTPACQQPEVVFSEEVLSFAKTLFIMGRTENDYSAFEKAMDEQRLYRQIPDFTGICLRIGADPAALDAVIYDELGYRGRIWSIFIAAARIFIKKDCGIVLLLGHFFIRFAFRRTYEALTKVNRFLSSCSP